MDKDLPNIYKGIVNTDNNQDKSILNEEVKVDKKIEISNKKDVKKYLVRKILFIEQMY